MSISRLAGAAVVLLAVGACSAEEGASGRAGPSDSPAPSPTSGAPEPVTEPDPCGLIELDTMMAIMGEPITAHGRGTSTDGYCAYGPVDSRPDLLSISWRPAPDQVRLADLPDLGEEDRIEDARVPGASDAIFVVRYTDGYLGSVDLYAVADRVLYEVHASRGVIGSPVREAATLSATAAVAASAG